MSQNLRLQKFSHKGADGQCKTCFAVTNQRYNIMSDTLSDIDIYSQNPEINFPQSDTHTKKKKINNIKYNLKTIFLFTIFFWKWAIHLSVTVGKITYSLKIYCLIIINHFPNIR